LILNSLNINIPSIPKLIISKFKNKKDVVYMNPLTSAVLELTNRCNLRCPFCASNSGVERDDSFTLGEWENVVRDIAALGGEEITIIGGEIFLFKGWEKIGRLITDLGMKLIIITNGLLVNDDIYERMTALDVYIFGVSLDGPNPQVYKDSRGVNGFDKAWALLNRLKDDGYPLVNAVTTFTGVNYDSFEDFVTLMEHSGITWQIQIANAVSTRFEENLAFSVEKYEFITSRISHLLLEKNNSLWLSPMDDFGYFPFEGGLKNYHKHWDGCQGGISVIGVRSNGDLLPCLSMGDPFIVANLREMSLEDAWGNDEIFSLFRNKTENLEGHCKKCIKKEVCRAGCSAMAFTSTGSVHDNKYCMRRIVTEKLLNDL
jgi:radical SAM protein with 4Fe4S-binding SPASM domain